MDEKMSSGLSTRVGAKCGRWNPTAEQVKVLKDLFSSGLRSPTTEQIQIISSHLSSFGKIESKNVFYWFQNHKARDRHHKKKRRRGGQERGAGGGGDLFLLPPPDKREARKFSTAVHEVMWEPKEGEIKTLELFPLSSYHFGEERSMTVRNEGNKELDLLGVGRDPPLDLQLSFF